MLKKSFLKIIICGDFMSSSKILKPKCLFLWNVGVFFLGSDVYQQEEQHYTGKRICKAIVRGRRAMCSRLFRDCCRLSLFSHAKTIQTGNVTICCNSLVSVESDFIVVFVNSFLSCRSDSGRNMFGKAVHLVVWTPWLAGLNLST